MTVSYFWFRRDLRLEDNIGLLKALQSGVPVQCIFIFDKNILDELPPDDARLTFIHDCLKNLDQKLRGYNSSLRVEIGYPERVWKSILSSETVAGIYSNKDYEPYAIKRDNTVAEMVKENGSFFLQFKDQVIFEKSEVVKDNGDPYTVFTPFKRRWIEQYQSSPQTSVSISGWEQKFALSDYTFPSLEEVGFTRSSIQVPNYNLNTVNDYEKHRDFPAEDRTSYLSTHLRFGTVGIRKLVETVNGKNETFLSELIWREFFMQILYHFPKVVQHSFREKYDRIPWRNNEQDFLSWCNGQTGYPLVDAGMRQLNTTGYMHNRVRMVVASFLCKHLLIDWRWGEAYFAGKLMDYDLSANNGNWQWAAGTGCDAAPYFRVFNPTTQLQKFDRDLKYIRKYVTDFDELTYPQPIVEHSFARNRAIETYKKALEG